MQELFKLKREQQQLKAEVEMLKKKVDELYVARSINDIILPKDGYASIEELVEITGLSEDVIDLIIDKVEPKLCHWMMNSEHYIAYKIKPIVKFAKLIKETAEPIDDE